MSEGQALKSMQAWADVANITFIEAPSTDLNHRADITFAYFTLRADGSVAAGQGRSSSTSTPSAAPPICC
ncbi:zinc metalloprotease [Serratia ficaria]|uniref:hypothetical protein n=1 Tax=Serratia ficaria TaxID=61651 RepID=UPI001F206AE7|nr:hypothetical protein [Serratia ficaria]